MDIDFHNDHDYAAIIASAGGDGVAASTGHDEVSVRRPAEPALASPDPLAPEPEKCT